MRVTRCTHWPRVVLASAVLIAAHMTYAAPPDVPLAAGASAGPIQDWALPPPYLASLSLTEDQQDRVFAILHGAAPALREQGKVLQKALDALRGLSLSPQYDESRGRSLAAVVGNAESELVLLHAHADQQIYLLLTPEQRTQLEEHHRSDLARRRAGP